MANAAASGEAPADQEQQAPLPHQYDSLEDCIRHRHSIRFYKPDAVPHALLYQCLELAQLAPSNSNIQNWRLSIASHAAKDRVVAALSAASQANGPNVPPLPEKFKHFRSEFGHLLYGEQGYGIQRWEKEKHQWAVLRNYSFFDAPVVAVITMDRNLHPVDAMSTGMFVQTFMLALTERGLGSCLLVSVTGYADVLKKEFAIDDNQEILCGMSIGWPSEENKVNTIQVPREAVEQCVNFLED